MLVGLGGNNGTTFTAGILANKLNVSWETKNGEMHPNFYGSFTQSATTHVGFKHDPMTKKLADVHKPIKELLPMANPVDFVISGWDISKDNLFAAAKKAKVLEPTLLNALKPELEKIVPLEAVVNQDFIAANQADRMTNVFNGTNRECIDRIRADIRKVKAEVDKVVILWTANTEMMFAPELREINDLMQQVEKNQSLPASMLYCIAAIEE